MQHLPRNGARQGLKVSRYSNSELSAVVDEYIHNEKHREMFKARYLHGKSFSEISAIYGYELRQTYRIMAQVRTEVEDILGIKLSTPK